MLAIVLLASASGSALAGTKVDLGEVRVQIDDQRDGDCHRAWLVVCPITISNVSDVRTAEIDASQNVSYIGAGVSVDPIVPVGLDYTVHGRDGYVPNPVFPFVGQEWSGSPLAPGIPGVFEVHFEDPAIQLYYNSVNTSDPAHPIYWHEYGTTFPDGQNRLGYNQLGPFNELDSTDTDATIRLHLEYLCFGPTQTRECFEAADNISNWQANNSPNVHYGLNFYEVEAASNTSSIGNYSYFASTNNLSYGPWEWYSYLPVPLPVDEQGIPAPIRATSPPSHQEDTAAKSPPKPKPESTSIALLAVQPPANHSPVLLTSLAAGGVGIILLAVFLYARIRNRSEAITSAVRCKIYDFLSKNPGISPSTLAGELGMPLQKVRHHLRVMERTQMISVRREGNKAFLLRVAMQPGLSSRLSRKPPRE
jgi:predicted transcriptional regulator